MDRFIGKKHSEQKANFEDLKSNMDRFIVQRRC